MQSVSQFPYTPVVVAPDSLGSFSHPFRNLGDDAPLIVCQLQRPFLLLGQTLHPSFKRASAFFVGQPIPSVGRVRPIPSRGLQGPNLIRLIESPGREVLPPVHASVIGILQNPRSSASFIGIEQAGSPVDLNEDLLHHVLCLASIPYNSQPDA